MKRISRCSTAVFSLLVVCASIGSFPPELGQFLGEQGFQTTTTNVAANDKDYMAASEKNGSTSLLKSSISGEVKEAIGEDVSVVITSSLIPSHPSIAMINQTIHSLRFLDGLSTNVPIFVTVDGIPPTKQPKAGGKKKIPPPSAEEDQSRLNEYVRRLNGTSFDPYTNVTILASHEHRHIAGSVHWAMSGFVRTKFVYVLQHDLAFKRIIDHDELMRLMSNTTHYPWLRNVRFRLRKGNTHRFPACKKIGKKNIQFESGLRMFATAMWSDNNQLSTRAYYMEMFRKMDYLVRPMEGSMMNAAKKDCEKWGQIVYGGRYEDRSYLKHLDGRHSEAYNKSIDE